MKHNYIAIVLLGLLTGCANNNVWVKDGAGSNEFESDKYTCMQQSQQQQGTAVVNAYGGAAVNGQVTNWNLYNNCMQARGWRLTDKDAYQQNAQQKQSEFEQKKTEYLAQMKVLGDRQKAVCAKQDYSVLLLKTPCYAKDITFEQIADSTKISAELKPVLVKYRTEIDAITKETNEYMHAHVVATSDKQWVNYLDSIQPDIEKYNLDLYKGLITWGEYNQQRKDLTAKLMAENRRLFPQPAH